ncbi:unnamed protein product [Clonostachys byssicola]|uniref:Thioesterase domain-containing protein n=1 Tax=Clonostachys byssicola TaxID=160290 RepID=A0A9N9UY00_9HYPO|nr:unnamed protein product [Clonostachys byssicola]
MFSRQFSRNSRQLGQIALRATRQRRCYATESQQAPSSPLRKGLSFALYGLTFAGLGAAGAWQALKSQGLGFYSDEASLHRFVPGDDEARKAEEVIQSHPFVAEIRKRTDLTESRPHMKMPAEYRRRSLTGGALLGPRMIVVPPLTWNDAEGREMVAVAYLGEDVCGHPGIVHGGLVATILDEGLARTCIKALPNQIAVTANLNINYRKPTPAGDFFVMKAETTKVEGRKAWVKGRIETLVEPGQEPVVLAEATALFVSPKYAAMLPKMT